MNSSNVMAEALPSVCIVFSGKRKSGKDYTVSRLSEIFDNNDITYAIARISEPIKSYFAQQYSLNLPELLSSNSYKENYRKQMIDWVEEEIKRDCYVFPRKALSECIGECKQRKCDVIIVSDARRMNDIEFFIDTFTRSKCLLIRITSPVEIRIKRGWSYVDGVDNVASECGLDECTDWDLVLQNDGNEVAYENYLNDIVSCVKKMLSVSL
ncbi:unnamed protein product [Trichobilharzia szidati]|nr:unnamed protein product [Trichobilharzia szidati]